MRLTCTSGSVGDLGGRPPRSTRPIGFPGKEEASAFRLRINRTRSEQAARRSSPAPRPDRLGQQVNSNDHAPCKPAAQKAATHDDLVNDKPGSLGAAPITLKSKLVSSVQRTLPTIVLLFWSWTKVRMPFS